MSSLVMDYKSKEAIIQHISERLKSMGLKATFRSEEIKPFIENAEATLYHERNKVPMHPDFVEFLHKSEVSHYPNNYAGTTAAIQYFVWRWHKKIPTISTDNYSITVSL